MKSTLDLEVGAVKRTESTLSEQNDTTECGIISPLDAQGVFSAPPAPVPSPELSSKLPLSYIERPKDRAYIYIFECGKFIKVGISKNLQQRQLQIEALNPHTVRLAYYRYVHPSLARRAEKAIHEALKPHRHRGEWFLLAPKDALPHLHEAFREALNQEQRFKTIRRREGWAATLPPYPGPGLARPSDEAAS